MDLNQKTLVSKENSTAWVVVVHYAKLILATIPLYYCLNSTS